MAKRLESAYDSILYGGVAFTACGHSEWACTSTVGQSSLASFGPRSCAYCGRYSYTHDNCAGCGAPPK